MVILSTAKDLTLNSEILSDTQNGTSMLFHCPCGSKNRFGKCCEPYIKGEATPSTAEALMRSRYTAFTKGEIDYIIKTVHSKFRKVQDIETIKEWAEGSKWLGLKVLNTKDGLETDLKGEVEFIASFEREGQKREHREIAEFQKEGGKWYFVDGRIKGAATVTRDSPKVGRNDPCPCGSKKKFKKCCGQ